MPAPPRADGGGTSSGGIVSVIDAHLSHFRTRLQAALAHYEAHLHGTITDLHSENQDLRRQLHLPAVPLVLKPPNTNVCSCGNNECCAKCCKQQVVLSERWAPPPPIFQPQSQTLLESRLLAAVERLAETLETQQGSPSRVQDHSKEARSVNVKGGEVAVEFKHDTSNEDGFLAGPQEEMTTEQETQQELMESQVDRNFELHARWKDIIEAASLAHSGRSDISKRFASEDQVVQRANHCALHPTSFAAVIWSVIFMLMITYELIVFPMRAFPIPEEGFIFIMTWICVCFWTMDLVISFFMGYQSGSGEYVMNLGLILKQYGRTWLLPDLIIVVVDWFTMLGQDGGAEGVSLLRAGKILRSIRVVRALRLLRLGKVRAIFREIEHHIYSKYVLILSNISANFFIILGISHFIGCLWYWVGTRLSADDESWVTTYLDGGSWQYAYLTAYHWALCQFTPGSMHVQPQSIWERAFANLVLVVGLIVFSSIVSSITNATNNLRRLHSTYTGQMWELRKFFKQENLSASLLCRVSRYADTVIAPRLSRISMNEVALLKMLPAVIHTEVVQEIYSQHLVKHPFFYSYNVLDRMGMHSIYHILSQEAISRHEVLFSPAQIAYSMYFVISGSFKYYLRAKRGAPEPEPVHVGAGKWFSEPVLWMNWTHRGLMRAIQATDIVSLSAENFRRVVEGQQHLSFVLKYGTCFIDNMNKKLVEEKQEMDSQSAEKEEMEEEKEEVVASKESDRFAYLSDLQPPPLIPGMSFMNMARMTSSFMRSE